MKNVANEEQDSLFVGAVELAMLDLLRQEYVENEPIKPLFVVDFPRLAQTHCVPPLHLMVPEVTGLLPSPDNSAGESTRSKGIVAERDIRLIKGLAEKFPETLGLAEVLSRFVFDRTWSYGVPKLMLSTQLGEADSILDALRHQSMEEWRRTVSRQSINKALVKFAEIYREAGKSMEDFIEGVADKAEELLPAIYGEYSQVRQLLRFEDIKPVADLDTEDCPVVFASDILELRGCLDEIADGKVGEAKFRVLQKLWEESIPETYQRAMSTETAERMRIRRRADVDTLATIEYLNDRLVEVDARYRLVFVSDDAKLFSGALRRFRVIEDPRALSFNAKRATGSASAFHRSRYTAHLLLATPNSALRKAPILDPRALMTGRSFVEFSVAGGIKEEGVEPVRAITEWLPVFFDGRERDKKAVANTYLHIQQERAQHDGALMTAEMFGARQYEALESHWKNYVRMVGTAHGLTRYSTRAHLRDAFVALMKDDRAGVEVAIHRQLDKVMSAWLPALGGETLVRRSEPTSIERRLGALRIRSIPPLLLPAWPVVQGSLVQLFGGTDNGTNRDKVRALKWITKPTAKNLGLEGGWARTPKWKLNYIQCIGLAYGFASEGNWTAGYRLASSAFSLAQVRRDSSGKPDESFISGREAAFLASVAARRSLASRPTYLHAPDIEQDLIDRLRCAIELEAPIFDDNGWQVRREAHDLRLKGEVLSWRAYRQLCVIMRSQLGRGGKATDMGIFHKPLAIELETWLVLERVLRLRERFSHETACPARHDYHLALTYLGRQLLFNLLQIEVFEHLACGGSVAKSTANQLKKILEALVSFAPSQSGVQDIQLPWSCFENHVLTKALARAGDEVVPQTFRDLGVDDRLATDGTGEEINKPMDHSLSEWRLSMLTQQ